MMKRSLWRPRKIEILVPLHRCIFSDQLNSVLAYLCLVKEDDREAPSFLFESVEPGPRVSSVGRYSVVGAQPTIEVVAKGKKVMVMDHEEGCLTEEVVEDPMSIPKRISESWKPLLIDDLPDAFCGGWIDYFSYDTVRYKAYVIHWVRLDRHSSVEKAYNEGVKHLEKLVARLQDDLGYSPDCIKSTFRTENADQFEIFRALRVINQSPYMAYLQSRGGILVASSPEILTRIKKVSKYGSVEVEKLMTVERYSHVMHISSTVKVMEVIDELEVSRRGLYSGGFGGISFHGDMDIALALRTMIFTTGTRYDTMYSYKDAGRHRREWVVYLQAGAGIVTDSDPNAEHRECEIKAGGIGRSIDLAESAFVNK
ncbi:Ethylene-dependent gravitropism-deficient and yellow-green-like 2 isoform 1 [Hibiscus syriacus]|uniref:Ethylene-dependent gravitropism-deficient and yellow-green-like 2 isoform 1 n=1 Tax=Hibiscus syriacus TaxID=106335 RepID=A0A6A3B9Q4_HIBSY|nr:Ethylene-dependent gravitropism-deficient and yellow-green-like 2 isoform 1 [Hibiscus syriacus]